MKKIKFIVEKTGDGYSAYHQNSNGIIATTGDNITELRKNILEATNLQYEYYNKKQVTAENISLAFDLGQFFEYYNVINVRGLSERIRMNYSLLSQYVAGTKTPSEKQTKKVLEGIKQLGRELYEADFI
ncbi:MAG: hypothetical protein ACHQIM_22435 [Sphingobacteriales bacterium]